MKRLLPPRSGRRSIRWRVMAIVAIPSALLLVLGVGISGYLIHQGDFARTWAVKMQQATTPGVAFITEVEAERRLDLLKLGGDTADTADLGAQRQQVDTILDQADQLGTAMAELNPAAVGTAVNAGKQMFAQLPALRQAIDAGRATPMQVYTYFNQLVSVIGIGLQGMVQTAPDPVTASRESTASDLFDVLDGMSRGNALAAGAVAGGGVTADVLREYRAQVDLYHTELTNLLPRLSPQGQQTYGRLTASPAWQQLSTMENAVIDRGVKPASGPDNRPLPMSISDWQNAAQQVNTALLNAWSDYHKNAEQSAAASGTTIYQESLAAGIGVLVITLLAMLIAFRLSTRLIGRLKRLRGETLELADERLPDLVNRLRAGESVDPATVVPTLRHGRDEIGEVADAFNKAQQTAVAAATAEAETRAGMRAVFLNIAHRSQVVVRRQLEVLDEAERKQEDPTHLELLFRLDHLATRSRRNAENLVILGGGRPGRKWRNPVSLDEITRSAVSETQDFARVGTVRLPDVAMAGTVVADLIHLLAELVDNATSFSPPESRVEVRGNLVGKGVVVEIEDQGLGMTTEQRQQLNLLLRNPPDFQVMALSKQMRLGLFVVAQLAARHHISVKLVESDYGGIRAIVLIPVSAIAEEPESRNGTPVPAMRTEPGPGVRWPEEDEQTVSTVDNHADAPPRHGRRAADPRAPLPRRQRQQNMAPQLLADLAGAQSPTDQATALVRTDRPVPPRTPERSRDTMAAVLRGTRKGRQVPPKREP